MDPLPARLEEFRSKEYWDSFFRKLDKKPFEWYGEWPELRDLVLTSCSPGLDILVAGCGNSELSALIYDEGCTRITNIDFSKVCIIEMLKKNVRARPKMRWQVMDMTKMQFPDASFDIVLDKGGLDALTGEPGDEGGTAGAAFLREVKRVLRPGSGRYLCVSLAQEHVIDLLLTTLGPGWHVTLHQVPLPSDGSNSPFRTYFLDVRSMATSPSAARQYYPTTIKFDTSTGDQNAAHSEKRGRAKSDVQDARDSQLRDLTAAVARFNERCSAGDTCQHLEVAADDFDAYHPGRRVVCYLGLDNPAATPTQSRARFTATVLDATNPPLNPETSPAPSSSSESSASESNTFTNPARARAHRCAVFLVPQGREHEWLFASEEGQWQLVEQASAARLILVTLNRGHRFGTSEQVQAELSPLVEGLAPVCCRGERRVIPYLTTNDGIGKRTILEEAESAITGPIVVEDVELDSGSQGTFRRLVFTRNQNLVQSEAALTSSATSANGDARKKKGGKKVKERAGGGERKVDHSLLTSEYHAAMVAGLALVIPLLEAYEERKQMAQVLVIGLGGGALPMFLHNHLPLKVKVVELDPVVAEMAQRHFGFVQDERMELHIGDGMKAVNNIAASQAAPNGSQPRGSSLPPGYGRPVEAKYESERPCDSDPSANGGVEMDEPQGDRASKSRQEGEARDQRLDVLIVDVDAGDASLSMTCPAPAFLERDFLLACRAALREGGMFVVNVVSRAEAPYAAACAMLKEVFRDVYEFDVDGDVNRVLFALHQAPEVQTMGPALIENSAKLSRMGNAHAPWGRGPLLANLVEGIKRLPSP